MGLLCLVSFSGPSTDLTCFLSGVLGNKLFLSEEEADSGATGS